MTDAMRESSPKKFPARSGRVLQTGQLKSLGGPDLAAKWVSTLQTRGYSDSAVRHYMMSLRWYLDHLATLGTPFNSAGYEEVMSFLESLRARGNKEKTLRLRLAPVSGWYKWLKLLRYVDDVPTDHVGALKVEESVPDYLTEEEIGQILATVRSKHWREPRTGSLMTAVVETFYATGVRCSELSDFDVSDVHLADMTALVRCGKGKKAREVFLNETACEAIKAWLEAREPHLGTLGIAAETALFVNRFGLRLSPPNVRALLGRLAKAAGITRRVHPHMIRHAFATHMLNRDPNLKNIQELMGHSKLSTTQVYLHVSRKQLEEYYRAAHPRGNLETLKCRCGQQASAEFDFNACSEKCLEPRKEVIPDPPKPGNPDGKPWGGRAVPHKGDGSVAK